MKQTKETLPSVANSVETTQEENAVHSTVFDDVFRTIAQKMPQLLIPLINEVFHTNYSEDTDFEQLRNEHYEKYGKIITDSIIRIGPHLYHIECQSKWDADMVIRMFEYDISIALEHTSKAEDIWEIEFPAKSSSSAGVSYRNRKVRGRTAGYLSGADYPRTKVHGKCVV